MNWVIEKKEVIQQLRTQQIREDIKQGVHEIVTSEPAGSLETDVLVQSLTDKLGDHIEKIMIEAEEGIRGLTESFVTGNIQLNNQIHKEKMVQLFILLQGIQRLQCLMCSQSYSFTYELSKSFIFTLIFIS